MSNVEKSWGSRAADTVYGAVEQAGKAASGAGYAVAKSITETATDAAESVVFAVDYWDGHSPETVTANFRGALDHRVSARLGPSAGRAARFLSTPVSAAARFSVQGAQGVNALRRRGADIAAGRAPVPSPGEVAAGIVVGTAAYVGTTIDSLGNAAVDGAAAIADGDYDRLEAATENALKAGIDVGAIAIAARGASTGVKKITNSTGPQLSGGGAVALQGAFNPAAAAQGALQIGGSGGALATIGPQATPRPIERVDKRVRAGRANEFPRSNLRGVSLNWLKRNKPRGWKTVPTREHEGFIWKDPAGYERLRFMRPNGKNAVASKWSRQENGCFRWKNAQDEWLDVDGRVVGKNDPNFAEITHIAYEGPL
ncbi:MAG: hypothetical protein AAF654_11265 [Myxococcota bacterium]